MDMERLRTGHGVKKQRKLGNRRMVVCEIGVTF